MFLKNVIKGLCMIFISFSDIFYYYYKMPFIRLKSSDGESFPIELEAVKHSGKIMEMVDDLAIDEEAEDEIILPLQEVKASTLRKVIEWLKFHQNDPLFVEKKSKPVQGKIPIPTWDAEFLNVDNKTLSEITLAAQSLHIKGLLEVCCQSFANRIKGKGPEEIRRMFNIKNDFSPSEDFKIKQFIKNEKHKRRLARKK